VLTFTAPPRARCTAGRDVDVIVADFMMPGMDGITFLRQARDRPLATRILLTGYADKENAIRAINEAGLYYYLEKPWNNEHLKHGDPQRHRAVGAVQRAGRRVAALGRREPELYGLRRRLMQAFL
jgi:response regulator RpfG family c-di-GMP phosphodiesterase